MILKPNSRRQFLTGAGGVTLAIPFLPSLLGVKAGDAMAATPSAARFIGWPIEHCCFHANRVGLATPLQFQSAGGILSTAALPSDMSQLGRSFASPEFNALVPQVMVVQGMMANYNPGIHNMAFLRSASEAQWNTTGNLLASTIDEVMARSPKVGGRAGVPMPAVRLGPNGTFGGNFSGYLDNGQLQAMPYIQDPYAAFQTIFKGITTSGSAPDPKRLLKQKTVVDQVNSDLKAVLAKATLGKADRDRLNAHIASLQDLETQFNARAALSATCAPPTVYNQANIGYSAEDLLAAYMDLMVAAMNCGITNVGMIYPETGGFAALNACLAAGSTGDYHQGIIHANFADAHLLYDRYLLQQAAVLGQKLAAVADPAGGSLLDNTIIMVQQEHTMCTSVGMPASFVDDIHGMEDTQVITIGGKNMLQTGKIFDFRDPVTRANPGNAAQDYNAFLMTLMTAVGLTYVDWEPSQPTYPQQPGFGYYATYGEYGYVAQSFSYGDKRTPIAALLK